MKRSMLLYGELKEQKLFDDMAGLLLGEKREAEKQERYSLCQSCAGRLIRLAAEYGFRGDLWHCFLAFCLANHENAFSTACEIRGDVGGTLSRLAREDMAFFKELFDCDIAQLDRLAPEPSFVWQQLKNYEPGEAEGHIFNRRIRDRILKLSVTLADAETVEEFQAAVTEFYREYGVGTFGLNKAFRIEEAGSRVRIRPIVNVEHTYLRDIVGYEIQKKKLIDNTEAFLSGRPANNVLLFGDAGTGKSSCIKGILNEYYDRGLRMIEVYKHQFHDISWILEQIQDRNYKFIIYMDDLSFEESELEYKYLKAIIEGGLGRKPKNVLIYATSNRRHLVRESFRDKGELLDEELHKNDTVQEKLSLVARFGVTIYFGAPAKKEFQAIVKALAERSGVEMKEEELLLEANKWELQHGGLSGRTASQFITYLLGQDT